MLASTHWQDTTYVAYDSLGFCEFCNTKLWLRVTKLNRFAQSKVRYSTDGSLAQSLRARWLPELEWKGFNCQRSAQHERGPRQLLQG
ncbi:hypothetical protein Pla144_34680 [Bythopirellula polymerisocia]|uniref:Uncharacterized protein n=1 Tax=Bythopirellula polymerisocia TaxID=2528003 RepID=A0A5C6CIG6_9BACT|nr:hypothetical protein Pla144_34680 [Bythopirellula polymerisocia]